MQRATRVQRASRVRRMRMSSTVWVGAGVQIRCVGCVCATGERQAVAPRCTGIAGTRLAARASRPYAARHLHLRSVCRRRRRAARISEMGRVRAEIRKRKGECRIWIGVKTHSPSLRVRIGPIVAVRKTSTAGTKGRRCGFCGHGHERRAERAGSQQSARTPISTCKAREYLNRTRARLEICGMSAFAVFWLDVGRTYLETALSNSEADCP
ncbi:hypothetical protein C8R45DRAFT_1003875 [Mycena sanguinolenta]|nr:hypothetical protein C8R45DRAFT_1003875 [Mycena sanguinolenta]